MRTCTFSVKFRAVRLAGMAAILLALGMLGGLAPAQDTKAPPNQEQPKQPKGKDEAAKKDDKAKAPVVKLGLSVNDPRALQGYTLMSPFTSPNTYLVDMQGRVVNTWPTTSSPALSAVLLDNGHLLRPGSIGGDATVFGPGPGVGGRIQEFTWEGELVWDFKFYSAKQLPHHDLTRLPNGNVLMIVWDRKTTEETIAAGRRPEMTGDRHFLPDSLVEIKPTGKTTGEVVWEWHLWDHLVQDFDKTKQNYGNVAEHPELVNINHGEDEMPASLKDGKGKDGEPPQKQTFRVDPDFTHFNGVAYNAELDQISVSVWKFSEFWIIDHSTTTAEAASHKGGKSGKGGDLLFRWGNPRAYRAGTKADQKLFSQHNAHWIPKGLAGAGNILLFNNGVQRADGNYSSVDELVLPVDSQGRYELKPGKAYGPDKAVWSYTAPTKNEFFSSFISGAQRLGNGNTLICSGANGIIFEVTPEKEIVWKYINPARGGGPIGTTARAGQIISPIAADLLALTTLQRIKLENIQKDVDARLDRLLTAAQRTQAAEGGPGASRPGQVLPNQEQNRLKLTDDQKKDVSALQKVIDQRFDDVLNEAQRKQLKSVFPAPPVVVAEGPQPGKLFSTGQQDTLKLSAEQRKRMAELQKEIDAQLETLLTEEQKQQLQALRQAAAQAKTTGPGAPAQVPQVPQVQKKDADGKTVVQVPAGKGGAPTPTPPPVANGSPLFRAYRYGADHPAFQGRTLVPGQLLEDVQTDAEKKASETKK